MSKLNETYSAFLLSLRPLLDDTPAQAALDAYLAARAERTSPPSEPDTKGRKRNAAHDHDWRPTKNNAAVRALAPKKAHTTLDKPECKLFACSKCGILSNRTYPYWFRLADYTWQMAKPPCVAPK